MATLVVGLAIGLAPPLIDASAGATAAVPATTQIRRSWETFFKGSTPPAKKIALVQNGPKFAAVIRGQAASPLAKSTTAKVTKVRLVSKTRAIVTYTVSLGGTPALKNAKGTSLLLQHQWKVSASSFCALLALEQVKAPACPK